MARWSAFITHSMLYVPVREQAGRAASPSTAGKGAQKGTSLDPQGFDAGKKITGRRLRILTTPARAWHEISNLFAYRFVDTLCGLFPSPW
jgi:hypothetical protein